MRHEKDIINQDLETLINYSKKNSFQLIIGTDSNAHSNLWGPEPKRRCKRGELLEDWIAEEGLEIHNQGNIPTFMNKRCATFIDLTLSSNLRVDLVDWKVLEDYNGSDHNTICFTLNFKLEKQKPIWVWKKAEWEKFTAILETEKIRIPRLMNERRLEYTYVNQGLSKDT